MDPVTIIGLISGSLSITAFLVNNIPILISKGKDMKNCERLLSQHVDLLNECCTLLENWRQFWYGGIKPTAEHCKMIWGERGWQDINLRLNNILWLSNRIKEQLTITKSKAQTKRSRRARSQNSSLLGRTRVELQDPVRAWLGLEGQAESDLDENDVKFLKRIVFGLSRHPELQAEIKNLRSLTKGLGRQAFNLYTMQGHADPGQSPTSGMIDKHKRSLHIAGFLSELLEKCRHAADTSEWSLELRLPDSQSEYPSLEDLIDDLRVDFLVKFNLCTPGRSAERRSIMLHETRPNGNIREWKDLQAEDLINIGHRINVSFDGVFYCIEADPGQLSYTIGLRDHISQIPLDDRYRPEWVQYQIDRASIALGTTLWFILLWPTKVFSHICSCRIDRNTVRFIRESGYESTQVHAFRLWVSDAHSHECHDKELLKNNLLLLSTLHGELALADPLRLQVRPDGSIVFIAGSDMPDQFLYPLSQEKFLKRIEQDASVNLAKAARFGLTSHLRNSGPPGRIELEQHVLKPVGKFYARRLQHYSPWQRG